MARVSLSRHRPATIRVDGHPLNILIARLSLEEAESYRAWLREHILTPSPDGKDRTLDSETAARVRATFASHISVPDGELAVDGEPVTSGAALLDLIGENPSAVVRTLIAVASMQAVSSVEGKPSASEPASVPGSDASHPAPVGPTPETTAAGAAPKAAAPSGDATEATESQSSGSTEILN